MSSMRTPDKKAPSRISGYDSDISQPGRQNMGKDHISNSDLQHNAKSIDLYTFSWKKEG